MKRLATLLCLLLAVAPAAHADFMSKFIDPKDGMFDLSNFLLDHKGPLVVPIIITEPAVGYGAGAALVFIRNSIQDQAQKAKDGDGHITPPDIFGLAAFATENGTKGAAAGGQFTFLDDRFRYRGGLGDFSVNLDFYGIGGSLPIPVTKIGYTLKGIASFQQAMMRIGDGDTFAGVRWIYLDLQANLDVDSDEIGLTPRQTAKRSSGLGVTVEHDSRDNIFTPNSGWIGAADATFYSPDIGSANTFQSYRAHIFYYLPATPELTIGLRADGKMANGDVPFYMLPFIDMRGIPAARYQDTRVAVLETEFRYDFNERWAGIAFIGVGKAWGERQSFDDAGNQVAKGVGFRYLVAERLGMYVGMDYAWGPQDQTFYIQVGNGWR